MSIIIYTVITGSYDTIKQPLVVEEGIEYILFTNNPNIQDGGVWKLVQILSLNIMGRTERENNILLSRKVKMLAHEYLPKGFEVSIYVDADMVIKRPLKGLLDNLKEDTLMAACRHSYCASVRDEIEDLVCRKMVNTKQVEAQWNKYVEWNFKDDLGISENGLLIRKHNNLRVKELMELWWNEYQQGCLRDQVSLMPCMLWLRFMPYFTFLEENIRQNKYVE